MPLHITRIQGKYMFDTQVIEYTALRSYATSLISVLVFKALKIFWILNFMRIHFPLEPFPNKLLIFEGSQLKYSKSKVLLWNEINNEIHSTNAKYSIAVHFLTSDTIQKRKLDIYISSCSVKQLYTLNAWNMLWFETMAKYTYNNINE